MRDTDISGLKVITLLLYLHFSITVFGVSESKPIDLRCEYMENPLGIDVLIPRLTWRLNDARMGARQTAYQIFVGTDSLALTHENGDMWKSAKVISSANLVFYQGLQLNPFSRYFWFVKTWDKDGKSLSPSGISHFETGVMDIGNWRGAWISDDHSINEKSAPYFRKTFTATHQIKSARAYIAVAGLAEIYINGSKVGNQRLDPAYTRFDRRTMYLTFDVTSLLMSGTNAIGVLLGNGWYNLQSTAVWWFDKAPWRNRPAFCMDLRLVYDDGSVETITSGKDWKTSLGPLVFNSIYTGEHVDSRMEQQGWNTIDFDDTHWTNVTLRDAPSQHIVSQMMHPIRDVETIQVQKVQQFNDSLYVFDFGRNISGVCSIKIKGKAGTIIRLKHGERLYTNGRVDQSNIDIHYRPTDNTDPFQTDIYILSGKGEETFKPRFGYKGFQYVEVSGNCSIKLQKESLTAYFMHSDVPVVGDVKSSNPIMDKIWSATNHSYLSNLFGYPTDCPQREKNGWTGDAHIAVETGLYNFDAITIYEKWLADFRDEQQPNGVLPSIIPTDGWGYEWGNGPDWTSGIAIIPWNIYLFYGDSKLLSDCYDNIRRYVDHIDQLYSTGLTSWGLGDWVPVKSKAPVELTSTVYYFADVSILAHTAKILGKTTDFKKYSALALKIKSAFNDKYLNRSTGIYGSGYQTELSVPLFWGIVPDSLKCKVAKSLARRVEADSFHLDVGLLGTKALLNALSDNGYADAAYKIASQKDFPSWGWWIANGATTLYENWPIDAKSDISQNHIMFGEIGAWLYKALAGIKPDPENPGFKNICIEPYFVENLEHFEASHLGPNGLIVSSWKRTLNKITYSLIIPPNSTAAIRLHVKAGGKLYENGIQMKNFFPDVLSNEKLFISKKESGIYVYEIQ